MTPSTNPGPARALIGLHRVKADYGAGLAATKLALLKILDRAPLRTAVQVRLLHEALCFLAAYPDSAGLFAVVAGMLDRFDRRPDLMSHRRRLVNTGIAGTDIVYPFHASTAQWLVERWGDRLAIEWADVENRGALEQRLQLFSLWSERAVFDEPPRNRAMSEWSIAATGSSSRASGSFPSAGCCWTRSMGS
jgi:hypothetical protein